jgi:hypothetical protein
MRQPVSDPIPTLDDRNSRPPVLPIPRGALVGHLGLHLNNLVLARIPPTNQKRMETCQNAHY